MMSVDSSSMVVTAFSDLGMAELLLSVRLYPLTYRLNRVLKRVLRFGV